MKIHQGTLRELVKEQLLEILEEDDTLLEMFMESARVGIIKSVSADIRNMIQKQAQQMHGMRHASRPPMQEEDGDGGYDGGYGGYGDYGMGGGGGGSGDGYTGNYHIPQARRKGMARFYENDQHPTLMGEGFDPEMAPNAFRNELNQAKQAISNGRVKTAPVTEMGDHQLDELMGESAQPQRQQRQAPQRNQQPDVNPLFIPADRQAYMEAMAMEAAVGDSYGPMPVAMPPDAMYMNEEYSRAIPQGAIAGELVKESLKTRPTALTPEERLRQAQVAPQHSGGYRTGGPELDRPVKELGLRSSGGETPRPLEQLIPPSQLRDGDGKPMVSVNDPRLDGKRHASSRR